MSPQVIDDSVEITRLAVDQDIHVNITINNRAGEMQRLLFRKLPRNLYKNMNGVAS